MDTITKDRALYVCLDLLCRERITYYVSLKMPDYEAAWKEIRTNFKERKIMPLHSLAGDLFAKVATELGIQDYAEVRDRQFYDDGDRAIATIGDVRFLINRPLLPDEKWMREDWTQDMLPAGTRPLLAGEPQHPKDEELIPLPHGGWEITHSDEIIQLSTILGPCHHVRTRRPLPEPGVARN